jgi:hypothetical protein
MRSAETSFQCAGPHDRHPQDNARRADGKHIFTRCSAGEDDATRTGAVRNLLFLYRAQHKAGHVDIRLKNFFDRAARSIWLSEKATGDGQGGQEWVDPTVVLERLLRGKGRRGAPKKDDWINIEIAAEVMFRKSSGMKRDDAIEAVANKCNKSSEAVRDIHQNWKGKSATKAWLAQLRAKAEDLRRDKSP